MVGVNEATLEPVFMSKSVAHCVKKVNLLV